VWRAREPSLQRARGIDVGPAPDEVLADRPAAEAARRVRPRDPRENDWPFAELWLKKPRRAIWVEWASRRRSGLPRRAGGEAVGGAEELIWARARPAAASHGFGCRSGAPSRRRRDRDDESSGQQRQDPSHTHAIGPPARAAITERGIRARWLRARADAGASPGSTPGSTLRPESRRARRRLPRAPAPIRIEISTVSGESCTVPAVDQGLQDGGSRPAGRR
jgi:hypothetical protein